jgi:hypothetical protein
MRREDFAAHLETFARTKAWEMCERESPVAPEELLDYERTAGFAFPPEYVYLACNLGLDQFGFTEVFSVRPGEWHIDVHCLTAPGLPKNFVPISHNGCGDFYGFLVLNGRCESPVFFADHQEGYAPKPTDFADLYQYSHRYGFNAA